jgi:Chaperone of endosialidase
MTNGFENTAVGMEALTNDVGGGGNSALGFLALNFNTSGNYNTASGYKALYGAPFSVANPNAATGSNNTGIGANALYSYSTGSNNTASGVNALYSTTIGNNNTASGFQALYNNRGGVQNTAAGVNALYSNNAAQNTAVGYQSLFHNTSGKYNVAVGWEAGFALTTGSNNIDIDNHGEASDSDMIRIGTEGTQTNTYIAGIYNVTSLTGGLAVFVDSTGHLGTASSSERFKTGIEPMGSNTSKLQQLRPVTFQYKADPQGTLRYGLIAEEVAKVYPELVVRDGKGRIDGVRYDELAPMLLNEMQQQQRINSAQAAEIRDLKQQVAKVNDLEQGLNAVLQQLESKGAVVAQR